MTTPVQARSVIAMAIAKGTLTRQPCEECGDVGEAHHEDYEKPLEVRWLCRLHHMRLHAERRPKRLAPVSDSRMVTFKMAVADYAEFEQLAKVAERTVSAELRLAVRAYLQAQRSAA